MTPDEHAMLATLVNIAKTGRVDGDTKVWHYPFTPTAATLSQLQAGLAGVNAQLAAVIAANNPAKLAAALLPPLTAAIQTSEGQPITEQMLSAAFVDALKQLAAPPIPAG